MSKSTKKLVSFLTAAAITASVFTVVMAEDVMTASYDAATGVVTVTNVPDTGDIQNLMIAAGTEEVDSVTKSNIKALNQYEDKSSTRNVKVSSLADGKYTVHVGGSNSTYAKAEFTVGSVSADTMSATYDKATKTITVSDVPEPETTEGTEIQTLKVTDGSGTAVAEGEYPKDGPISPVHTFTLENALADGTYTVTAGGKDKVGNDLPVTTCTFEVASLKAVYNATEGTVTVSNITISGVGQTLQIVDGLGSEVAYRTYVDSLTERVISGLSLSNGTYTVSVTTGDVSETCTFTVSGDSAGGGSGTPSRPTATPTPTPTATPTTKPTDKPGTPMGGRPSGTVGGTTAGVNFKDLDTVPWAKVAITTLASQGIINGRTDEEFDPNGNITRAEFAKLVCLALNIPIDTIPEQKFTDVTSSHWAFAYVSSCAKYGIINGVTDTEFDPEGLVTREQMATMLYRAINASSMKGALKPGTGRTFADSAQISEWAREAVEVLSGAGIINGVSDTHFAPAGTATRAQAACIIYQCFQALALV